MTVRAFRKRDLAATIEHSYAGVYPPRAVAFFKSFHNAETVLRRAQAGTVLVVEDDGEIVATGSLDGGEILAVFVHPRRQGCGIGVRLMASLEASAQAAGVVEIRLSVSLPARRFYERLGYHLIEAHSKDLGAGQRLDYWKAAKLLVNDAA